MRERATTPARYTAMPFAITTNKFGRAVVRVSCSPRWPLLGLIGSVAWLFDGRRLWIGIANERAQTHRTNNASAA